MGIVSVHGTATMAVMKLFIASLLLVGTNAFELTPTNVDDAVAGKTVFIKFLAPW